MSEFQVVPSSLEGAGSRLGAAGNRMSEARATIASTAGAGAATGDGEASAAFSAMLQTWTGELASISNYTEGLGTATQWAGSLYQAVDSALFGGGDG